jgi:hypothetical protein
LPSVREEEEAYAMAINQDPRGPQDLPIEALVEHLNYNNKVRSQRKRSRIWDKFAKKGSKSHHSC